MFKLTSPRARQVMLAGLLVLGLLSGLSSRALAQGTGGDLAERSRAMQLFEENKFADALPLLEKLAAAHPDDTVVLEQLGWATIVVAASMKDPEARKQARERARKALLRAKELGDTSELLRTGLEHLAGPDPAEFTFSSNKDAEAAMRAGEEAHSRGDLDAAITAYQRALQFDPKLYMAALFTGDMYFKKGYQERVPATKKVQLDKAGEWFARAIAIDPDSETAYRYWGDALMAQGKPDEARQKFIEAIVAEPFNRTAYVGLMQWAEQNNVKLGHPNIEPLAKVNVNEDKKVDVFVDPKLRDSEDGSGVWEHYAFVRTQWVVEKFAKAFPTEKTYRHSLQEETDALRKVAEMAADLRKSGKVKALSPSLEILVKLNDAGLLEPYVLFARVDRGIAQDYADYRRTNRDKLKRYWNEIVVLPY